MCLGVPMKVVELDPPVGELGGLRCRINLSLLDSASVGDYVIVHAGYAIEKLEEEVAQQTLKLMQDLDH
ncbi:MAG: HypC/HybG/HupF family hydrogenase formation chaperone [Candidatus Brocadiaceae bacterium]|nr:HypC/HybG/HupF family hydrogenase formation chaperone [Candidatus Brocadiaceae bacterium]